ncbi:hypothetical protein BD413DRAFT_60142 [Trametes elegans]|nr:hypothetical protein BD413DRAFT_60142 [Trametes elegans]
MILGTISTAVKMALLLTASDAGCYADVNVNHRWECVLSCKTGYEQHRYMREQQPYAISTTNNDSMRQGGHDATEVVVRIMIVHDAEAGGRRAATDTYST